MAGLEAAPHMDDMIDQNAPLPELMPGQDFVFARGKGGVLLIACGALAREIVALIEANRWPAFDVQCLPAIWHNTPSRIPEGVRKVIRSAKGHYRSIFVLYGDCGTGGLLDKVLAEEGVERIDGPHCYAFLTRQRALRRNGGRGCHHLFSHRLSGAAFRQADLGRARHRCPSRAACRSISATTPGSSILPRRTIPPSRSGPAMPLPGSASIMNAALPAMVNWRRR